MKGADRDRPSTSTQSVHSFVYDRVFGQEAPQQEIFDQAVLPVVESVLGGKIWRTHIHVFIMNSYVCALVLYCYIE